MPMAPIGVQNFASIRDGGYYYVDKTAFIDDVLRRPFQALLYVRPRRFGKSTNLSMLDAYLDMRHAGNSWFDGLAVSEIRPDDPEKNAYPVIYLDMKELSSGSFGEFLSDLRLQVSSCCKGFPELLDSDRLDFDSRDIFRSMLTRECDDAVLRRSIKLLSDMLRTHFGVGAVILVDEYDQPVNSSYGTPEQGRILAFMHDLFSSAFKGNDSMRYGVVTGVMQISKESIFSGLNNQNVNNVLSVGSDEMFGFTPAEVERLCADFGHPERFGEAREWYDGYRFGEAEIYNPWSLLSYVENGFRPAPYWSRTGANDIIDDLLAGADDAVYDDLLKLGSRERVRRRVETTVTFDDLRSRPDSVYSVMVMSGYLTAVPDGTMHDLYIPNTEMYMVFSDRIGSVLGDSVHRSVREFSDALLSNDVDAMGRAIYEILAPTFSVRMTGTERPYQAFLAGMLTASLGNYGVEADFERGQGYFDILLRRRRGNGPNIVIELRGGRPDASEDEMTRLAEAALEQIASRDYAHGLPGETIAYGMAFSSKRPTIVSKVIRG